MNELVQFAISYNEGRQKEELEERPVVNEGELLMSDYSRQSSNYWLRPDLAVGAECED